MKKSIVIPVWNGADVIGDCLESLHEDGEEAEIICVDNGSQDGSAALIQDRFPEVTLLRQPANLGFAGGVNVGIKQAGGELVVLLNQDCVVSPGWLSALEKGLEENPHWGIIGAVILGPEGEIEHAGAFIRRPDAVGVHLTHIQSESPYEAEYVTGAVFGVRRSLWETLGRFDAGYFPAYYEESDFCYRARHHGHQTGVAPDCRVRHLHSSRAWQVDSIRHTANELAGRYRFVAKHFDVDDLKPFFAAERRTVETHEYFDMAIGRTLAARQTLRNLDEIHARRSLDQKTDSEPVRVPLLHAGLVSLLNAGLNRAGSLAQIDIKPERSDTATDPPPPLSPDELHLPDHDDPYVAKMEARLRELRDREYTLLSQLYRRPFPPSSQNHSRKDRLLRALILLPFDRLSGRHARLHEQLDGLRTARLDAQEDLLLHFPQQLLDMDTQRQAVTEYLKDYLKAEQHRDVELRDWLIKQLDEQDLLRAEDARLQRQIALLKQLVSYDYR